MTQPSPTQKTKAMLAMVWSKNRDLLLHRLESIEEFCRQLPAAAGNQEIRMEASADAHKLAGSLGMFGLSEGTEVAREIEYRLRDESTGDSFATEIPQLASRLRSLIELFEVMQNVPAPERGKRLLILDASADVANAIATAATERGMEAAVAGDLGSARQALQDGQFDLLVLDLATAELSGEEEGEEDSDEVRDLILSRAPMQVLALTSVDSFEDRVTAAQIGAHGFLPKTVAVSEIVDTCQHLLDMQSAQFKVLTVDDDVSVLSAIKVLLEQFSIRVTSLADPRLFWTTLEEAAPDLVILDLDMPSIFGLELCRAIRNDPQWNRLPVVFLSVNSDPQTVTNIFSAGADDFVPKPIIAVELTTRIRNRLERDRLYRTLSDYDQLTGVRNRRSSNVVIANYLRLAERHGLPLSLAIVDLDKFKSVNDTYGHQAGDDVLQHLGGLLRQSFRSEDVVARWGGEEFVIAMFAMRRGDAIERMANVLEQLEGHGFEPSAGTTFRVSFSAGVAEFPSEGKDLHSLYRVADQALFRAKDAGRRRIYSLLTANTDGRIDVAIVGKDVAVSAPLQHLLEMRGYSVKLYLKPAEAMAKLTGATPSANPRLVLLDESAPSEELVRGLRERPETPPILLLTSVESSPEGVERVTKPYKSAALMQRVRRVLQN